MCNPIHQIKCLSESLHPNKKCKVVVIVLIAAEILVALVNIAVDLYAGVD